MYLTSPSRQTATTFVSYWSTLVIQTVTCSEVIYVRPAVNTVFIDKHCCSSVLMLRPHAPFGTVFPHLYALLTVSLVLGLSSRLTCSPDICSRSTVRASDTLIPGLSSVINSLLTYLLTLVLNLGVVFWGEFSRIISIVSVDLATHPQDPAGRRPLPYLAFSFTVSYSVSKHLCGVLQALT